MEVGGGDGGGGGGDGGGWRRLRPSIRLSVTECF